MFSSTLRATLVALVTTAVIVSAAPGLSVNVSGPEAVDGVENFKVVATVINTGDEALKLLNDPRSALSSFPTNTFVVTSANDKTPGFIGAMVKYAPSEAAKSDDPQVFTVLNPGQSIQVTHDLSGAYDFTASGADKYTVEPSNVFLYIDPETNEPVEIHATVDKPHVAALSGKLAVIPRTLSSSRIMRRATYLGCTAAQQADVALAIGSAQNYANDALTYLQTHGAVSIRYTTWFGVYTNSRHDTVETHFTNIKNGNFSSLTYDCNTCNMPGTFAYVYPNQYGTIYLCALFWNAANTGSDSKAGTLIHEASHFTANGGTADITYGKVNCTALALTNPDSAITNADNHEYFAENDPFLA